MPSSSFLFFLLFFWEGGGGGGCLFFFLFSFLLFEWFTLYIYMFRLTIIGSINTFVPNFSLSLSPFVHAFVIWTVRIVAASSHLLCVWFRPTLIVLASIICNLSACLSSVFVYIYMQYCHLNTSLFIVYLNHIFIINFSLSLLPFVGFWLWF